MKLSNMAMSIVVVAVVLLIIVPMPTFLVDVLITINISLAVIILLISVNTKQILEFSTFPSILLVATVFRIALNVKTTVLILGNGGYAGDLIQTFGNFITSGNVVVGIIMFLIIVLVQFLVITKGAERVAEVTARFTLDSIPGKQMAIDADLNSGLIDEAQARQRRINIQRESDFYSSMDGASKFVKGDAIMGIILVLINSVGGIIIGVAMGGQDIGVVADLYVRSTIGDGLSSQIPALLISVATGLIITKSASDNSLGEDVATQIAGQPMMLMLAGAAILVLSLMPGMPKPSMFAIAAVLGGLGFVLARRARPPEPEEETPAAEIAAEETRKPESVVSLLQIHPIELEVGYGLIPLADASQGGDLIDRVVMIRRQSAVDLGVIVPVIRVRDNLTFAANEYVVKIKGNRVASGEIMLDHYLAMNPGDVAEDIEGIDTREPAYGLPAKWVNERQRERAELLGYTITDPPSVIAVHLTEVVRRHAHELLGRQQVQVLIDNLKQQQPALVDEVIPKMFSLGDLQKVLANLLREGVSIRDMATIVETMGDFGSVTRDPDMLTEYVRQALRRTITGRFVPDNRARVVTLDPTLEHLILDNIRQTEHGSYVNLEPDTIQNIFGSLRAALERMTSIGLSPIILTAPVVRFHFKRMVEQLDPDLVVLSYNELEQGVDIQADGIVTA